MVLFQRLLVLLYFLFKTGLKEAVMNKMKKNRNRIFKKIHAGDKYYCLFCSESH